VEESMNNLETVVRERNEAYYKLETGQTGERPVCLRKGAVGKKITHTLKISCTKWFRCLSYEFV
jgi:large subunit ribosomal protein L47